MDIKKFAMNYGAVLGLFLVAIAVIMWSVGVDDKQSIIPGLLNNGITIAFIAYAIIQYRDINNNGFISYASSLKLGTTIAFFSSIIFAFYAQQERFCLARSFFRQLFAQELLKVS